jgi:hypothetical protein
MSEPPSASQQPSSIPSTESVPGFFVVAPRAFAPGTHTSSSSQIASLVVVGSASSAEQIRKGIPPSTVESNGCFAQLAPHAPAAPAFATPSLPQASSALPGEWSNLGGHINVVTRAASVDTVIALHGERVVDDDAIVRLESTDAWFDTSTHGMRLIGKTSLPLRHLASEPGGFDVYAGRDERPDGKRLVQFVVLRRKDAPVPPHFSAPSGLVGFRIDGAGLPSTASACSHLRVPLGTAVNAADSATLRLMATLPPLGPGEKSPAAPIADFGLPSTTPMKDVRTRSLDLHVGVSQMSSEREPLLAVSASWAAREQLQRVPVNAPAR